MFTTRSFGFSIPFIVRVVFSPLFDLADAVCWSNLTLVYMSAYGVNSKMELLPLLFAYALNVMNELLAVPELYLESIYLNLLYSHHFLCSALEPWHMYSLSSPVCSNGSIYLKYASSFHKATGHFD